MFKIAFAEKIISPPVGTHIAGYGPYDETVAKLDDLFMSFLAMDDGSKKVVLISYDLLGIDADWIKKIRLGVSAVFGGGEYDCIISCTHTHTGPHTRSHRADPNILNVNYLKNLLQTTVKTAQEVFNSEWRETEVFFYSCRCDENINRRYIGPENRCSFLPHRRDMEPIADGFCDKELCGLFFRKPGTRQLEYIIGNYAAHPLAGHGIGVAAHRISADYPGEFRRYIKSETGTDCMFVSGAAGDMVPRGHETGVAAIRRVGSNLAAAAVDAMILAMRNPDNFHLADPVLQTGVNKRVYQLRPHKIAQQHGIYKDCTEVELEMQLLSIGDFCMVGVPGELLAELGMEIKWHSPFRKTMILYCSTAYFDYLCHANALTAGGYEAREQRIMSRSGLQLVNSAVEGMYELYEKTFTDKTTRPENNDQLLVSLKNI